MTRQLKRRTLALVLILGLIFVAGCGEKQSRRAAAAPSKGVVGTILRVQGKVTYSLAPGRDRTPLKPGMKLRAEWTVHTGPGGGITARLSNGHRWTLAGDLSKRISKIHALTLAPVKEGAVAQLSDLGAGGGKDRSAAAGLHQERTAGSKAAPTQAPAPPSDAELDEVTRPTGAIASKSHPMTTKPAPRKHERQPKSRRSPRRRRAKQGSVAGRYGRPAKLRGLALGRPGGTRNRSGGSAGTSGGGPRAAPRAAPRGTPIENAPAVQPAKRKTALAKRLTQKQLNRVIGPLRARLAGCLKLHKVVGTASVRLVIQGSTGRVTAVLVAGCTSRDAAVRCMFARTRRVLFPRFTAPTQTSYTIRVKAP